MDLLGLALVRIGLLAQTSGGAGGDEGGEVDTEQITEGLTEGCDADGFLCDEVYDWTGSETLADWTSFLLDRPLKILLVVIGALIVSRLVRRGIDRLTDRVQEAATEVDERAPRKFRQSEVQRERAEQRAETLSAVLRSLGSIVVWTIALLIVLGELGIDLGPLIAGAGIAGVALGFGAQSLVKDFLSGVFMLIEDQYGVGDIVDVGEAVGTIEKVTLRTTVLRDLQGTVWHVPNGEIRRVGNLSQHYSRALLDVGVAYGTDVEQASEIIERVADEMARDPEWRDDIEEEPEVWGVQDLAADQVLIRLVIQTEPAAQWGVERELRRRIKRAFDEEGIEIPFPQRTIWLRHDDLVPPGDRTNDDEISPSVSPTGGR